MSGTKMLIPRIVDGREFYKDKIADAMEDCQKAGYKALFMPEILDTRVYAPKEARIWQTWYCAPSIRATGKTKQGSPVVVYAHIPNHFSDPKNIRAAIEQGLINGAGIIPNNEFQRLLDMEDGENVFVVDYKILKSSESDVIPLRKALAHPQTIPFCGGRERAEKYLLRHNEVYGKRIGNWHSDDLGDEPRARLLFFGGGYYGLDGNSILASDGRFAGVSEGTNGAGKIAPGEKQIKKIVTEFVAPCNQKEVEERIAELYKGI